MSPRDPAAGRDAAEMLVLLQSCVRAAKEAFGQAITIGCCCCSLRGDGSCRCILHQGMGQTLILNPCLAPGHWQQQKQEEKSKKPHFCFQKLAPGLDHSSQGKRRDHDRAVLPLQKPTARMTLFPRDAPAKAWSCREGRQELCAAHLDLDENICPQPSGCAAPSVHGGNRNLRGCL